MFLRFVVHTLDEDSGRRRGVIHAAAELRGSQDVSSEDSEQLRLLSNWFDDNLERPSNFAVSNRPHAKGQAISWFKASATEHIRRAREASEILARYGIDVDVLRTTRPGYLAYEDDHQVTAYPFSDTPT